MGRKGCIRGRMGSISCCGVTWSVEVMFKFLIPEEQQGFVQVFLSNLSILQLPTVYGKFPITCYRYGMHQSLAAEGKLLRHTQLPFTFGHVHTMQVKDSPY